MAAEKPTSRRDFLRGRAAARALVDAAQQLIDQAAAIFPNDGAGAEPRAIGARARWGPASGSATARCQASRRIMACEFAIEYHAADGSPIAEAAQDALDLIERLEDELSIYREHSDVSRLNRHGGPVAVERSVFELLVLCARLHEETGGAFDPTGTPLSRAWGFLARAGRLPSDDELAAARAVVGFEHVKIDAADRTIERLNPGLEINFNAIGKGYALDRACELMASRGAGDFLAHGGRSSVAARGRDRSADHGGWSVVVPHPTRAGVSLGELILRDEALGTTGAGVQFFEAQGRRFGHVIDARTGRPADGVLTATVVAPSAAEADALSTALYVLGPGGAAEYCAAHRNIGAVVIAPADGGREVDGHAFNLGPDRWRPAGGA